MRIIKLTVLSGLLLAISLKASDQIPAPPQTKPILLKNGTIHTVSGDVLPSHDLLFSDGRIQAIEPSLSAAPDMEVIELNGDHVYPGLILADVPIGLVEINAVRATRDIAETGSINPNVRANVSYNPDSEIIPVTRSNGVLLANVAPQSGLIPGQSSLMQLDGWTWEDATLLHRSGLHLNWPSMALNLRPRAEKSVDEQKDLIRQQLQSLDELFDEVRAYHTLHINNEIGTPDFPGSDIRLESMIPYVTGEKPIFVHANDVRQIEAAVQWAKRQTVNIVIVGGRDSWRLTNLLAEEQIPVLYQHIEALPSRRYEPADLGYRVPQMLYEAHVPFCISTSHSSFDAANARNLPYHASLAAAHGLPAYIALRSITLSTAEILGVDDRVGSLEEGKDATLFIATGDILDTRTTVKQCFIQGRKIDMSDRHKMLYKKYREKYRQLGIVNE